MSEKKPLTEKEIRRMLDKIAEEHEKLRKIKRTHRCPACGEVIQGYAYPLDDLECRVQEHVQLKHLGGMKDEDSAE